MSIELPEDLGEKLQRILRSPDAERQPLGVPAGTEMAELTVETRSFTEPEDLVQALQALGPLTGWWEFSDKVVTCATPALTPAKAYLLSADLWDERGTGYAVRHMSSGWALNTLTKVPSRTSVVVAHHRLARKDDNVQIGNLRFKFEVSWKQETLFSAGVPPNYSRLVPFASRFAGFV